MIERFKKSIMKHPYQLFLLAALFLFVFSFLTRENSVDIHLHDTMFVISTRYIIWALAIIFILAWAVYKLTNEILWTKYLSWFHVVSTLFILAMLLTIRVWHDKLLPPIERDFTSWQTYQEDLEREMKVYLPIAILFLAAQAAFMINLLVGAIKKIPRKKLPSANI